MKVIDCPEESDVMTFNNKVMGVFADSGDLHRFAAALEPTGAGEAEILAGPAGERCLQQVKHSVEGFLDSMLGDMESSMIKVYLKAVNEGATVFAVPTTSENRDAVVAAATRAGAQHIAHFGQMVTESFQMLTGDAPP